MLTSIPNINPVQVAPAQEMKLQQVMPTLAVGQLLKISVASSTVDSQLMLNIDGKNINAKTNQQFFKGEVLNVKVDKQDGQTVLKIQDRQLPAELVTQALRQVLPRQAPPTALLNLMQSLTTLPQQNQQALPPEFVNQVQQLVQSLPTPEALTTKEGLKQALTNSGTFLESKLAKGQSTGSELNQQNQIPRDFKGRLLKLFDSINQYLKAYTKAENRQTSQNPAPTTAQEFAKLLGRAPSPQTSQLTQLQTLQLEQAARLKNAQTQTQTQTQTANPQAKEATSAQSAQATRTSPSGAEMLKHASLPIKGAVPQPIKTLQREPINIIDNKQLLETFKEHVSQSVSRIQANQITSMPNDSMVNPTYLIDVPIAIEDKTETIPFLVEEEANPNIEEEENDFWSISLALDMENLGEVQVKVSLKNDKINVNIWAREADTTALFLDKEYLLQQALLQGDLDIDKIAFHQGLRENNIDKDVLNLLDLRV